MIVPGLIAVVMMVVAAMLSSLTIAREWERGTMEQLASTPVHRVEVIFGKLAPYLAIGLVDVGVAVLVGMAVFHVPFRGSALWLLGTTLFFLLGTLGLGNLHQRGGQEPAARDPDRDDRHLPAVAAALGADVRHREHALRPADDHPRRARPLLHRRDPRTVPEGRRAARAVDPGRRDDPVRGRRHHPHVRAFRKEIG
jgi:hypothetical protein